MNREYRQNEASVKERFASVAESKTFTRILKIFDLENKSVLDIGRSYGKGAGLDVRVTNIEECSINFDKKFDVIFANNIFGHLYYSPFLILSLAIIKKTKRT